MRVLIPSALTSYTGEPWVEADGATADELLADLDRRYPGIRFRIINEQGALRRHMRFFHGRDMLTDLHAPLSPERDFMIVQALSGG
jgi:hypothetical protein